MLEKERPVESVQEWWEERSTTMLRVGQEVLSIRAGRRSPGDKDTWWCWNDKVQEVINLRLRKRQGRCGKHQEGRYIYREANKA